MITSIGTEWQFTDPEIQSTWGSLRVIGFSGKFRDYRNSVSYIHRGIPGLALALPTNFEFVKNALAVLIPPYTKFHHEAQEKLSRSTCLNIATDAIKIALDQSKRLLKDLPAKNYNVSSNRIFTVSGILDNGSFTACEGNQAIICQALLFTSDFPLHDLKQLVHEEGKIFVSDRRIVEAWFDMDRAYSETLTAQIPESEQEEALGPLRFYM